MKPIQPKLTDASGGKDISVVIVNYNTHALLHRCLESLLQNSAWPERLEVIVVDNASSDESAEMVRESFGRFKLIANDTNLGFAAANNQGIMNSRGRYIVLLNPDTEVSTDALVQLVSFMDGHPDAAACGPKLLNPDGSFQHSCRRFPTPLAILVRGTFLNRFLEQSRPLRKYLMLEWDHRDIRAVDWVSGACLVMRREALEELGPLDERFFVYYEDIDWCYRAWQSGWRIYYNPRVTILHHYQRTSSIGVFNRATFFHLRSILRLFRKHSLRLSTLEPFQDTG